MIFNLKKCQQEMPRDQGYVKNPDHYFPIRNFFPLIQNLQ